MRAAIYARKSNDDSDRNPENKSVVRQIERARAYAKAKGCPVDEEHIYTDDGVSGAEYVNRPGFARLIASLPKRGAPPFDVLIMSEASRLGRDMARNTMYVLTLIEAGVRIFYYLTDEEEKADSPEQKIMVTLRGYASEVERMKAGQRSRDALARKAERGYNAGGVVYGYDNVKVLGANGVKSHTDYRINAEQAEVIRGMFRACAAGHGHVAIAKALNGDPRYATITERYFDGARPASPRKGTGSWAPSSVRPMLYNERYRGIVEFGKFRKAYRAGTKVRLKAPTEAIQRVERPDLRIVREDLWREAHARLAAAKDIYLRDTRGKLWGRPGAGVESRYLLSGLGTCGVCGRGISMIGGRRPNFHYGCSYHQARGRTICANDYKAHVDEADKLVLGKVKELLTPERIERTIDYAFEELAELRRSQADRPERLEAELKKAVRERDNLLTALANGKGPKSIVDRIAALDAEIAQNERELERLTVEEPSEFELRRLRGAFRERLGRFEEFMASDVTIARQALKKLLAERIGWYPENGKGGQQYRLHLALRVGPLLDDSYIGASTPRSKAVDGARHISVASPRGTASQVNLIPTAWEVVVQAA